MAFGFRKFWNGITIKPVSSNSATQQGDIEVNSVSSKIEYHNGSSESPIVTETHASQGANRLQNKDLDNSNVAHVDSTDTTKKIGFDSSAATTSTQTTIKASQTAARTVTLPDATDTLVGRSTTDTLANKTLSSPTINTPTLNGSGGALTLPAGPDTLVGRATTDTLTNKTLTSPTINGGTIGSATINTPTLNGSGGQLTLPAGPDTLTGIASTQNLSNKTFSDSPVFNAGETLQQIATPATPASGYNKIYPKSDGYFYSLDPTGAERKIGSGAGSINYVQANPDAESGTTGWATYREVTPGASPLTGTGGSPSHITLTATGTNPLRGSKSFLMSNSGSTSAQGEGVSFDFAIDPADQATVLQVSFDYTIASGTFQAGTQGSSITPSDVTVWAYDKTNTQVIQLAPYVLTGNGSNKFHYKGVFQTASNSTSYRLILHVGTTNNVAWGLEFDNVSVGPQIQLYGSPVTDWNSNYTLTSNITTNATLKSFTRRVGDSLEVSGNIVFSGTNTQAVTGTISLPAGLSVDSTKFGSTTRVGIGSWGYRISASGNTYSGEVTYNTTNGSIELTNITPSTNYPTTIANGDLISFLFVVPIAGWSSTVLMSNDTDTRVVVAQYAASASQSISSSLPVNFDTKIQDTHGAVTTGSGWKFTAPVPGYYRISVSLGTTGTGDTLQIYKNGVLLRGLFTVSNSALTSGSLTEQLVSGDYIDLRTTGSQTTTNSIANNHISIERISGPSAIAASETVSACYQLNTTAVQNLTTTGTFHNWTLPFPDKQDDTHGFVTASTGDTYATVPVSGRYRIDANVRINPSTAAHFQLAIVKNGSYENNAASGGGGTTLAVSFGDLLDTTNGNSTSVTWTGKLVAGDVIRIHAGFYEQTTYAIQNNGCSTFTLTRIGN